MKKADVKARHVQLIAQITEATTIEGQERNGYLWSVRSLQQWADALGVSTKTISRLITVPPIWSYSCTAIDDQTGKRVRAVALRVGDAPERTPELVAGIMSKMFRRKYAVERISPRDFGCLVGLAKVWPDGHQEKIFADTLINWPDSAKAIKLHPEYEDAAEGKDRYLAWPCISLMRRFPGAVADAYLTRLQASNKPLPFAYSTYPENLSFCI